MSTGDDQARCAAAGIIGRPALERTDALTKLQDYKYSFLLVIRHLVCNIGFERITGI